MTREKIIIPNQGHTLACMIRAGLFANNASFASCIVSHPQDTDLSVEIDHSNPKECLLATLRDVRSEITSHMRVVDSHMVHMDMMCMSE